MFNHILFPSDRSDNALRAAAVAGEMAKKLGSVLTVACVFTPPSDLSDRVVHHATCPVMVVK
jgi:nucleotide-binding universal stress UspA family protein